MQILVNHIGYEKKGPKKAVINAPENAGLDSFALKNPADQVCYSGKVKRSGPVDGWKGYYFWNLEFSDYMQNGEYYLEVQSLGQTAISPVFTIEDHLLERHTLPNVMNYFFSQHCLGRYDRLSRSIPVEGTDRQVDVHGGWHDASGDKGQYLTHLSHSIYLNPQQTPMVVWNFLNLASRLENAQSDDRRLLYYGFMDEAAFGGDFLVRMKSPEGYFYMGIRNVDYNDPNQRYVAGMTGDTSLIGEKDQTASVKSGYREGAGIAIAALARLSSKVTYGDYDSATYLNTAITAFHHLEKHNLEYLYDGKENMVDDYCALLAATELYITTGEEQYYHSAKKRAESLISRQMKDGAYSGHFSADDAGTRPFYHPADAGLPVVALLRFADVAQGEALKADLQDCIKKVLDFHLNVTEEVNNPFGYARQLVKATDASARSSFFMPHHNETGYWWQGENATIASLASMAFTAVNYFKGDDAFCTQLIDYGINQLNWVLGLNPFDSCMLHGIGHNNRNYYDPLPLVCGGICNGITSGYEDESDIAFDTEGLQERPDVSWRWTEQWIPHGAWYALAVGLYSFTVI